MRASITKRMQSRRVRESLELYAIFSPVAILIFVFSYIPMYGIVIAFQDYVPGLPFWGTGTTWVGWKHFVNFVTNPFFPRLLKNTLTLSLMNIVLGFPIPIIFALLLNEVRYPGFRKFTQTASYMPHFISMVVVSGMVLSFIETDGIINQIIVLFGGEARAWNIVPQAFPWIYVLMRIWKSFGWSSILYLSTITAIDPGLYEAASLDGAGRFRQCIYITLPFMLPLIVIQMIFSLAGVFGSDTQSILLLYNPSVYSTADVFGTFLYRQGLLGGQFSFGTAAGLLMTVLNFIIFYIANAVSRKLTDYALW